MRDHAGVTQEVPSSSGAQDRSGSVAIVSVGATSWTATRSTTWWVVWANAGVEALRRSVAAQQERRSGAHWYPSWRYEMEDGLVAVTSAVFAIEAITRQLSSVEAIISQETLRRWRSKKKGAGEVTREVLKASIRGGEGQALGDLWEPLFLRRNGVVHFTAEQRASVPYDGMNIAVEEADFTADRATAAFDLLFDTLDALGARPKPPTRCQAEGFAGQLELLRARRRAGANGGECPSSDST